MVSLGGTGSQGGTDVDLLGKMDKLEPLDPKDPLVGGGGGGGGSPTSGGGRVLTHKLEALSYSTLASLVQPPRRWSQLPVYAERPRVPTRIQHQPHIQRWGAGIFICVWGRV